MWRFTFSYTSAPNAFDWQSERLRFFRQIQGIKTADFGNFEKRRKKIVFAVGL
jgi:hypothetical protein